MADHDNYLEINREAYEQTANEFEDKIALRLASDEQLVPKLCSYFEDSFDPARILELGPGSGAISKLLSERGHLVTAIEFSPKMAAVARRTAPEATILDGEFLNYDFGTTNFDVIIGIAFIHLFPEPDARKVLRKIVSLLEPQGIVILSTTLHGKVNEGLMNKTNFNSAPVRYRRQYTAEALRFLAETSGFSQVASWTSADSEGDRDKVWLNQVLKVAH